MKRKEDDRVLQGAYELFHRHGVKRITMDDIAQHLGISKKTIYELHDNKSQLVRLLMKRELEQQYRDMLKIRKSSENSVDEIMKVMHYMADKFALINPNMFYDLQKYHSDSWKYFREFKETKVQIFIEENLKKGVQEKLYRNEINIPILARLRMEQIESCFNPNIFPPDKFKIVDVCVELLDHFIHGITTIKGHKLIDRYKKSAGKK